MARVNGSAAARGYTPTHWKLRAQWKPMVESGQVQCHAIICLEERDGRTRWIRPGAPWHLGHTPDRTGWTGPEHQRCGASDGATRGNQQRPRRIAAAIPGRTPVCKDCGQEYHYAGKDCLICGRHYHPSRGVQYTCSRACGKVFRYGAVKPLPPCQVCGKPCTAYKQSTCSAVCRDRLRAAAPESRKTERACEFCGTVFSAESAKFCSEKCAVLKNYYATRGVVRPRRMEAEAAALQAAQNKRRQPAKRMTVTVDRKAASRMAVPSRTQ